ncbi:hypothetical protein [Acidovorax sp.]|uniref:hypothetical protein n=1 Tax=Acidovorax sp. TaxID=1872122 RepID=UPI003D022214
MTSCVDDDEFLFLACVSRWEVARARLLTSPCLQAGKRPLWLRWNASSAAEAFNDVMDASPPHRWVVWLHQDVVLPEGWDTLFSQAIAQAEQRLGRLSIVGAYGVIGAGVQARHAGHVLDRGHVLRGPAELPSLVDSLDELLVAVRSDSGLRMDPALGWDFYATDLVLQAQAAGQQAAAVDAFCEHWSDTPSQPPLPRATAQRIAHSGTAFEAKWESHLPVTTTCVAIQQRGDVRAMAQSLLGDGVDPLEKAAP